MLVSLLLLQLFVVLLLHVTIAAVFHVTPDDYNCTSNNSCLDHYLKNASKYFTSHSQLVFPQGHYRLNDDIVIQNVSNFSLIGKRSARVISTIVTCSSSSHIAVINSSNVVITNMVIKNCTHNIRANFTKPYPNKVTIYAVNCWNITFSALDFICNTLAFSL